MMNIFDYIEQHRNFNYFKENAKKTNGYFDFMEPTEADNFGLKFMSSKETDACYIAKYKLVNYNMPLGFNDINPAATVTFYYYKLDFTKKFIIDIEENKRLKNAGNDVCNWRINYITFVNSLILFGDCSNNLRTLFNEYEIDISNIEQTKINGINLTLDQFKDIVNFFVSQSWDRMRRERLTWRYSSYEGSYIGRCKCGRSIYVK